MTAVAISRPHRPPGRTPLLAIRRAKRLRQVDLARIAGCGGAQIAHIEQRYPEVWSRLVRLADGLGVSCDQILGREPVALEVPDALARADRELLNAMEADAIALFGPKMLQRVGGWRRVARSAWLGYLGGRRDQDVLRPDNSAPLVEEATAQHRKAVHRAAQRGQPTPRYLPPAPRGEPEPGAEPLKPINGRIWPKDWYESWESPRQAAYRLNLPVPTSAELQMLLRATEDSKALPAPAEQGKVVSAAEAAQRLGIPREKMVRWIRLGMVRGARRIRNWWSVPVVTVEALEAAGRPRLTEGATP